MLNNVFSSIKIGKCEISNRLVVPAMVTNYCTKEGFVTDRYIAYMAEKAKGGFGLLITEDYGVVPEGKGYERIPSLYCDEQIEKNIELTDAVHKYGGKIFCQLYHPGRQTTTMVNGGADVVAPSAIKDPAEQVLPREITVEEIKELVENFSAAATRVKKAGFDGIELHAGHGYLIAEFLSPYYNKRTDEYGGCFRNRVRLLDEIYAAIRKEVGDDYPISVRYSGEEFVPGGRKKADTIQLALHLKELGVDAHHVSNGTYASDPKHAIIATMYTEHALNMDMSAEIKRLVDVPVIVTNRINDPEMAEAIIAGEKADMVGMGRGSICDPFLPQKAAEGKFEEIQYCIGCHQGCFGPLFFGGSVTCLVNPNVGREFENNIVPAIESKRVMVVGGGPGGLEAALVAAKRGHKVTLYEKNSSLGGQFRAAACPVGKGELTTVISSLRAAAKNAGVEIVLNTEVTEEIIKEIKPDAVIAATGARPFMPPIDGIDNENVVTAEDILLGKKDIGYGPVVVCGGGEVGGEAAHFISQINRNVTILEGQSEILNGMAFVPKMILLGMLKESNVAIQTGARVKQLKKDSVVFETSDGTEKIIPAETIVSAFGYRSYNPIESIAKEYAKDVIVIGGAVIAGSALTAIKEGYEAGIRL